MSLLAEIQELQSPNDSKQFLTDVKKILQNFKDFKPENDAQSILASLVHLYLDCPSKLATKRAMASFFQGLDDSLRQEFEKQLCSQLKARLTIDASVSDVSAWTRHCVNNVNSLMENFQQGEKCILHMFIDVLRFLNIAERHFLSGFRPDVPPVRLNEIMLNCHVTMQTINLVLQKTAADCPQKLVELRTMKDVLSNLMDMDLQIIHNESFLLDCRCCCAMNVFLLLQLTLPDDSSADVIPSMMLPKIMTLEKPIHLEWLTDAHPGLIILDKASPLTFLALTFGFISMVTASNLSHRSVRHNCCFYIDILLPNILDVGKSCDDTSSKTLYAKTVNLWTTKLLSVMQQKSVSQQLVNQMRGESQVNLSLLDYVWTHWEDQLDVFHQSAKTVFENVLKLHVKACILTDAESTPFILSIVDKVLAVSWASRGKFGALASCAHHIGTDKLLNIRPTLPEEILQQLREQAVSCHASELYSSLFLSHQKETESSFSTKVNGEDSATDQQPQSNISNNNAMTKTIACGNAHTTLMDVWICPVIKAMHSSCRKWTQNIIEYLLPKLMKSNVEVLDFMIEKMSSTKESQSDINLAYGAIIMCLRRARVMGLLKCKTQTASNELWFGILHPSILQAALCSLNEQIRLDAFALLCENCKTTEAISSFEFEMLKLFIPYNVNSQSPAFRQTFLALLKKLFFRLKESLGLLNRLVVKKNSSSSPSEMIKVYESFLVWLINFLLSNIYPGSTFACRTTCLACLNLVTSFFNNAKDGFSVPDHLTEDHLQTFIECFSDTYEDNKKEALTMLTIYTKSIGSIGAHTSLKELLTISLTLACSTKPQDCGTAAYIFALLLKQSGIWEVLQDYQLSFKSDTLKSHLNLLRSTFTSSVVPSPGSNPATSHNTKQTISSLYLLSLLCLYLKDQIEVARKTLVMAAANRPMYPTLHCIRYIIRDFDWNSLTSATFPLAKQFINDLIHACLDLAEVVSPVVQNSSPEGNVPADAIISPGLNMSDLLKTLSVKDDGGTESPAPQSLQLAQSVILSQTLVEAMPEYLVVCCWRSVKEVSLVLGKLCLQIPVAKIGQDISNEETESDRLSLSSLLSLDQITLIGEYFTHQLLESIHRGAFELAYAGFQLMCQMLWSHPLPAFHKLPSHWLQQVMADIRSQESKLCATRRSAGVPFFVQAITSSEPPPTGRKCFHGCIKTLISLAIGEKLVNEDSEDAQVHALNILRMLYRDARLGEEVVPYIAEGLKAAILGFKSDLWSVRNSATLLLSALMTRIFGVKRSKDESAMSKKNCQTGRAFFHRYPSLYPFLLSELESATASVERQDVLHLHPSLYPVLLVLGRLFPSTLEGSDTSLNLSAFIPYVLKCASSPVYKTRIIAARALQPLAKRSQVTGIFTKLLDNLMPLDSSPVSSSLVHGSLMQLRQLMTLVFDSKDSLKVNVVTVFTSKFMACSWLLSSSNQCYATRQEALKLVDVALDVGNSVDSKIEEFRKIVTNLETYFTLSLKDSSSDSFTWKPFFYELEKTKANLIIKHLHKYEEEKQDGSGDSKSIHVKKLEDQEDEDLTFKTLLMLGLLDSPFYEARLEALSGMIEGVESQLALGTSMKMKGRDTELNDTDDTIPSHTEGIQKVRELMEDSVVETSFELSSFKNKSVLKTLFAALFDYILTMAMEKEDHHECIEKVFHLLAVIPDSGYLLQNSSHTDYQMVFTTLQRRIETERRVEVKASMLKFSSRFVSLLYNKMESGQENHEEIDQLKKWIAIQTRSCRGDESPDLQISVALSLLENASLLLCDPQEKLGAVSLLCWDMMAILLQADDLEVKEIAASALAVACGEHPEAFHPNYALHKLPEFVVNFHSKLGFNKLFKCLVSWILLEEAADDEESEERLFERGEMNTYWDQVAFIRSVTQVCLQTLKSHQSNFPLYFDHHPHDKKDLEDFIAETINKLVQDLRTPSNNVDLSDALLNPGQYTDVHHILYAAKRLYQIFKECECFNIKLPPNSFVMEELIAKLQEKIHIHNI